MQKLILIFCLFSLTFLGGAFQFTIGADLPQVILDKQFYYCLAGRLNYENLAIIGIPYSPNQDFTRAIIYAKEAGFAEVYLLVDANEYITASPNLIAQNVQSVLANQGLNIQGVFLKVFESSPYWQVSQTINSNTISNILQAFGTLLPQTPYFGVYTTSNDWQSVTGGNAFLPSGHYYWAAFGETGNCNSQIFGFTHCYIQQIGIGNNACGYQYNIDALSPF